ncbi:hypothetical protein EYZ11_011902 [Aspergillus tanneri]|uniref:FAD/NAD(P)-binding domain-containing protein n=1 Tax=Aspergillus tanneri TaxID=1220188 RepID=A0A4S3J3R2_9EURO|nr:hypothetical protein EYZ11_011902 [Aspergillus tanneri]
MDLDVAIIGAGWHGLAALKTYHQLHPDASILLLEAASSVGGVWAKHRLYAGLKSNNMRGTYEFSDFPLDESFGVQPGQHVPGPVVQRYMERFVEHFDLTPYIRLNARVHVADHQSDGSWVLTVSDVQSQSESQQTIATKKLIVCTGITSQPYLPSFVGQDGFDALLFHIRDLPIHQDGLLQPDKRIAVYGGTKSAWDAVYAAATAGARVDWIIRDNGHGPVWMAPPYVTPFKLWLEKLVTTRLITWMSPCIWGPAHSRLRTWLHGSWLGRKIVDLFWSILAGDIVGLNRYNAHPETRKLQPWSSPFWIASGLSILNYPSNFFDLIVSGQVRVHINHIDRLSERGVHLAHPLDCDSASASPEEKKNININILPTDALICCTGWQATPPIEFRPASIAHQLGFPWNQDPIPVEMMQAADSEILARFPRLAHQPSLPASYTPVGADAPATAHHPFRLARFMVPPALAKQRSLAFMGMTMTINTTMIAQVQALWIAAYFDDGMALKSRERCPDEVREKILRSGLGESTDVDIDLLWETTLHSQFGIHRYPAGFGKRNPDFVLDAVPYVDSLLTDLGMDINRKGSLKWWEPYGMEDYRASLMIIHKR